MSEDNLSAKENLIDCVEFAQLDMKLAIQDLKISGVSSIFLDLVKMRLQRLEKMIRETL